MRRRAGALRARTLAVLSLVSALAAVAPAYAAGPSDETRAREAMQAGITAFGRGDAEAALREYERAKQLVPSANLPYRYAAEALLSLGRNREAIENLKAYLDKKPDVSDADAVRARIRDLEEKGTRGDLALRSTVPGAIVRVDGNEPHVLPFEVALPAGEHAVAVESEGYVKLEQKVTVVAGRRTELVTSLVPLERPRPDAPPPPSPLVATAWPTVGVVALGIGAAGFVAAVAVDAAALGPKLGDLDRAAREGDPRTAQIQSEAVGLRTGAQVAYVASVVTIVAGAAILIFAPHHVARGPKTGFASAFGSAGGLALRF